MKQWVIAGLLAGSVGLAGAAAQQPATGTPSGQQTTATKSSGQTTTAKKPAAQQPAGNATAEQSGTTQKPATRARRASAGAEAAATGHTAPKEQPKTADEPNVTTAPMNLGRVHIPAGVTADGKPLPAGVYDVRLTADEAKPNAAGTTEKLERWVEFVQRGAVKGKEVVSIVPENEIKLVQKDTPPRPGMSKVERLKGGDYVRVWINRGGTHYLIHLPTGAAATQ
jgi:hypothetical protein